MLKPKPEHFDVIIIGSGAAGMTLALHLPDDYRIAMLCKEAPLEGSSYYAQGGVAAVLDEYDRSEEHTLTIRSLQETVCVIPIPWPSWSSKVQASSIGS